MTVLRHLKAEKNEKIPGFLTAIIRCSAAAGRLEALVQLSDEILELPLVKRMCADVVDDFHYSLQDVVQLQRFRHELLPVNDAVKIPKLGKCLVSFAQPHKSVHRSDHGWRSIRDYCS